MKWYQKIWWLQMFYIKCSQTNGAIYDIYNKSVSRTPDKGRWLWNSVTVDLMIQSDADEPEQKRWWLKSLPQFSILKFILRTSFLLLCISSKPAGSQSLLQKIKWQVKFLHGLHCSIGRKRSYTCRQMHKWYVGTGEMRMWVRHPFSW